MKQNVVWTDHCKFNDEYHPMLIHDCGVAITLVELGRCLIKIDRYDEAKRCLDRSLQIQERISSDVDSDRGVAIALDELGRCLMKMH